MSIHEQYKRWKLIMKTLHQLHQTKKQELNTDVIKCVLDGTLLDFYEVTISVGDSFVFFCIDN